MESSDPPEPLLSEQRLARAYVELMQELVSGDYDLSDFLHLVCERVHESLEVDAVGVVLESRPGRLGLSAASTDEASALDLFELQAEQGPCFDAYTRGEQVTETDLSRAHDRWPDFTARATAAGFRAVYAFPLRLGTDRLGAMNVFHQGELRRGDADSRAAQSFADMATVALAAYRALRRSEERAEQLQHALDSRVLIEQAKGILAERHDIDVTSAFWRLRSQSKRTNTPLREVCRRVVHEGVDVP